MKRERYISPVTTVITIEHGTTLLAGSPTGTSVYGGNATGSNPDENLSREYTFDD
jgi:hypothetical protein